MNLNKASFSFNQIVRCIVLPIIILLFIGCAKKEYTAQEIVDKSIKASGGEVISNSQIHFKFRKYHYFAERTNGLRTLQRCTDKECITQQDIIQHNGKFVRFRESEPVSLPDTTATINLNSVNSVHYFAVLPYGLNDPAVKKSLAGESMIKGEPYYRIKVSFAEIGGGDDFEDQYMYWIHKESFHVDYLAYNYQVNEGGTRFRAAYNKREINGVRFVDYQNFKPSSKFPPLHTLDSLYENKKLDFVSKIELEDITVNDCTDC